MSTDAEPEPIFKHLPKIFPKFLDGVKITARGARYAATAGSFGYTGYFLYEDVFGKPVSLPPEYQELEGFLIEYQKLIQDLRNSTMIRAREQRDEHKDNENKIFTMAICLVVLYFCSLIQEIKSYRKESQNNQEDRQSTNGEILV